MLSKKKSEPQGPLFFCPMIIIRLIFITSMRHL